MRRKESTKLDIRARVEEAYTALKAMVEEEERSRSQTEANETELISLPEETDVAHVEAKERYHVTTGEGAEQDALSTCEERPAEDKVEIPIVGKEIDEESVAMDKLEARHRGPSTPNLKRTTVGPESPRDSQKEEGGGEET